MAHILAVDPGPKESAAVLYSPDNQHLRVVGILNNERLKAYLSTLQEHCHRRDLGCHLAVEMIASYGMPVGKDVFDTCVWIGRFLEHWDAWGGAWSLVYRRDVKLFLCEDSRAKDKNIKPALIDLWGGEDRAIGGKKCPKCKGKGWYGAGRPRCPECHGAQWKLPPGPLHDVHEDLWAALAVAMTAADQLANRLE